MLSRGKHGPPKPIDPFRYFRADAAVEPQRRGHGIDVAAVEALAQLGQHVGVGNLGGDERVERQFGQLGIGKRHAGDARLGVAHLHVKRRPAARRSARPIRRSAADPG